MSNKFFIERLGNTNYTTWAIDMELLLSTKNVWAAVQADGADAADNANARALLGYHLGREHKLLLQQYSTAKGLWDHLKAHFGVRDNVRRLELKKQLNTLQLERGESIDGYLARVRKLVTELAGSGNRPTDQDVTDAVLNGLPTEFDSTVEALCIQASGEMTLESIAPRLLAREQKIASRSKKPDGAHERAYMANGTYLKGRGSDRRQLGSRPDSRTVTCYNCGERGHIKRKCPAPAPTTQQWRGQQANGRPLKQRSSDHHGTRNNALTCAAEQSQSGGSDST